MNASDVPDTPDVPDNPPTFDNRGLAILGSFAAAALLGGVYIREKKRQSK